MKRLIRIFGLPLFFVLLNGAGAAQTKGYFPEVEPYNSVQDVSIVQVISNPPEFDGKRVRFIGFARIEFEGDAIYLHREDYEYGIARDAIWLNRSTADMTNRPVQDAVNMHSTKSFVPANRCQCEGARSLWESFAGRDRSRTMLADSDCFSCLRQTMRYSTLSGKGVHRQTCRRRGKITITVRQIPYHKLLLSIQVPTSSPPALPAAGCRPAPNPT